MSSSARRALRVLEIVGRADRPLGVTEIGRRLETAAGTVYRSLDALERAGYVARYQASSRYVLGAATRQLRQSFFAGFRIREICLPFLRQLAFMSGETTSLSVPLGWYAVRIAASPGTKEVTNAQPLGEVRPLSESAAGRALLAFLAEEDLARYRAWAARRGAALNDALGPALAAIRADGFALDAVPYAEGRAGIALPIRSGERAVAAIAIEGPVAEFPGGGSGSDLGPWIGIARTIEDLVRAQPGLFENPFDHIDPDEISLSVAPWDS